MEIRYIIRAVLVDGSEIEILSPHPTMRDTVKWFKGIQEVEVETSFYPRHSIFSWSVVDAKEKK